MTQRTLENFAKCKNVEEFNELCNSISGCGGCQVDFHDSELCLLDMQDVFTEIKQIVRKKKLEKLLS